MANKITIQDIADELGVSRNTVSKALNNTGVLSEKTKQKVLTKAKDMGYKQFIQPADLPQPEISKEIALFTHAMPDSSHFAYRLINVFQKQISKEGYRLSIYIIRSFEYEHRCLPQGFSPAACAGILCVEIFDQAYTHFLCSLNIPLLLADTFANKNFEKLAAHVLYMENKTSVYQITRKLIDAGIERIGFVGDIDHCHSFYERWLGYCDALTEAGISCADTYSILADEDTYSFSDHNWLGSRIKALPELPQAFICANDFYASDMLRTFNQLNISVPEDVLLAGYDDSRESRLFTPPLTTVKIPEDGLGYMASAILLSKIKHPESPYSVTYVHTDVIYRESTGDLTSSPGEQLYDHSDTIMKG